MNDRPKSAFLSGNFSDGIKALPKLDGASFGATMTRFNIMGSGGCCGLSEVEARNNLQLRKSWI